MQTSGHTNIQTLFATGRIRLAIFIVKVATFSARVAFTLTDLVAWIWFKCYVLLIVLLNQIITLFLLIIVIIIIIIIIIICELYSLVYFKNKR